MVDTMVESLILDLLQWLTERDRSYEEVMDAWRTSCPKLPVWEDANEYGFIAQREINGVCMVSVTTSGLAFLGQRKNRHTEVR